MSDLVAENPEVEKIAKILCSQSGVDPYRKFDSANMGEPPSVGWRGFTERAKEILTALYSSEDIINFPPGFTLTPFKNSAPGDSILISAENPDGWPLEDLLHKIADELSAKSNKVAHIDAPAAQHYHAVNGVIINLFEYARKMQIDALEFAKAHPFNLTKE